MPQEAISDPDNWFRSGRGRVITFFTTATELQDLLLGALPEGDGPWRFTGADLVADPPTTERRRRYVEEPFICEGLDLRACGTSPDGKRRPHLWAFSDTLTTRLPRVPKDSRSYTAACSLSGFIGVQRETSVRDETRTRLMTHDPAAEGLEAVIGHVARIVTRDGEIERVHAEYARAYERLRRRIRARLVEATGELGRDGSIHEDARRKWTRAAIDAYDRGVEFHASPMSRVR